jgi:peptidoglycan lytic transglycosylase D
MRFRKLYLLSAPLGAMVLATIGCSSAKPSALLPPTQATAPALTRTFANNAPPADVRPSEIVEKAAAKTPITNDAVAELIAQVEKEYQAGQTNYQAGHLDAAKQNFDNAFNLLLSGPVEINADERLQKEFEKLLDGVNGLELTALQEGDGFTEQKSEPAPIDQANEVTPAVDASVKAKAAAEVSATHSDLPLVMNDTVAAYISYFSNSGRSLLEQSLIRGGRYEDMIRRTLKDRGLPEDLIYLAEAESGFKPLALSRAGARGMWQFMGGRGSGYGLERSWWVDERQDPEKSTRAAARHLKDLYNQFGDWYLAMAAYNSGPGTVQSAVKRTGYADFWELYRRSVLPRETRNYVPIIVAVTIMAKNPAQYGLDRLVVDKPVPIDMVKIDYPVDLRLVAECIDVPVSDLQELNPSLLRMTTPKGGEFELHLPAGSKDRYLDAIAAIPPGMRVWWRYHKVQDGDSLASIARSYRTTAKAISSVNNLDNDELEADSKLIIPIAPGKHALSEDPATYSRHAMAYRVKKGDTVATVAENFGVPPQMVRRWNRIKGDSLRGRRAVYVHLPVSPSVANREVATKSKRQKGRTTLAQKQLVHHKVKQGETLSSIATSYNTTVSALQRDNGKVATLRPGMILIVRSSQ